MSMIKSMSGVIKTENTQKRPGGIHRHKHCALAVVKHSRNDL